MEIAHQLAPDRPDPLYELITHYYQTIFLLRFQENLSIKEISEILDCSEGTIKSRLFHTTKKLMIRLRAFNPNQVEV